MKESNYTLRSIVVAQQYLQLSEHLRADAFYKYLHHLKAGLPNFQTG